MGENSDDTSSCVAGGRGERTVGPKRGGIRASAEAEAEEYG